MLNSWWVTTFCKWLIITTLAGWTVNCQWTSDSHDSTEVYVRTLNRFDQPVDDFLPGERVRLDVTLENTGPHPLTLSFFDEQRFDFTVYNAFHQRVWKWSDATDQHFLPIVSHTTLGPGERWSFSYDWDQTNDIGELLPAGTYEVVGEFVRNGEASTFITLH